MASPGDIHVAMINAWNSRDFQALRDLLHPEYSYTAGTGKQITGGPEVGVNIAKMFASAFPDGKIELVRVFVQGGTAIAEMVGRGTHQGEIFGLPPTGSLVQISVCSIVDLRDGKVFRERMYMEGTASLAGASDA